MLLLTALMGFLLLSGGSGYAQTPVEPSQPAYAVTLTAYNAVAAQTDSTPFETASGAYSNPEVVAARSGNLARELPFGTVIEIIGPAASQNSCGYRAVEPLIGYRVIADTMNARYTDRIDILFSMKSELAGGNVRNAGRVLGICSGVTVRVVGYIPINRIPKTQAALVALVHNAAGIALK